MHRIVTRVPAESLAEEARCKAFYQLQMLELKRSGASFEERMTRYCDFYCAGMLPDRAFSFLAVEAAEQILGQANLSYEDLTDANERISCLLSGGMPDVMVQAALVCFDLYEDHELCRSIRNELLSGQYWCAAGVVQNAYFGTAGGFEMN